MGTIRPWEATLQSMRVRSHSTGPASGTVDEVYNSLFQDFDLLFL